MPYYEAAINEMMPDQEQSRALLSRIDERTIHISAGLDDLRSEFRREKEAAVKEREAFDKRLSAVEQKVSYAFGWAACAGLVAGLVAGPIGQGIISLIRK